MPDFYNQAELSYSGGRTVSNQTVGERVEVISAFKTAVVDTYAEGYRVHYVMNIMNSGTLDITGLTVTDDLGTITLETGDVTPLTFTTGSFRYYHNATEKTTATVTPQTNGIVFGNVDVPAGGGAVLVYETTVNEFAPLGAADTIVNTAVISGGGLGADITVTETISTIDVAELSVTKTITPSRVTENGRVTYGFIISNRGNTAATAADNIIVSDKFDPILSSLEVLLDGTALALTTGYTYDAQTGDFATAAGVITVPAAKFGRDTADGSVIVTPGTAILTVSGTI